MSARLRLVVSMLAFALLAAGCGGGAGSSSQASPTAAAATIKADRVPGLGTVLVNADGYVLYMFVPDHRDHVTCTNACAKTWPPASVPAGTKPQAGPKVRESLLGTVPNPNDDDESVVTYDGWPLYTYLPDVEPGQAKGQAADLSGGLWYVLRPSGKLVKHPVGVPG